MRHHLPSSTQAAKNLLFAHINAKPSPSPSSPKQKRTTPPLLTQLNPTSNASQTHNSPDAYPAAPRDPKAMMSPLTTILLSLTIAFLTVLIGYLIYQHLCRLYFLQNDVLHVEKRLRKRKPVPLALLPTSRDHSDIEAQPFRPEYQNPFSPPLRSPRSASSSPVSEENGGGDGGMASATGSDASQLMPLSPARVRARARRYGGGVRRLGVRRDEGGEGGRGEDALGLELGEYFFDDGVGIKRYERGVREE